MKNSKEIVPIQLHGSFANQTEPKKTSPAKLAVRMKQKDGAEILIYNGANNYNSKRLIIYYHHAETRTGEIPKGFLADFTGYLHCDGYTQ